MIKGEVVTIRKNGGIFHRDGKLLLIGHPSSPFPKFVIEPPVSVCISENDLQDRRTLKAQLPEESAEYVRQKGPNGEGLYLLRA